MWSYFSKVSVCTAGSVLSQRFGSDIGLYSFRLLGEQTNLYILYNLEKEREVYFKSNVVIKQNILELLKEHKKQVGTGLCQVWLKHNIRITVQKCIVFSHYNFKTYHTYHNSKT